jgi:hypothetical protein
MTKLRLPIDGVFYFMQEIFKDIPGYDGLYQASNLGRIKSLSRKVYNKRGYYFSKERFLTQTISKNYQSVRIKNGSKSVHQLVAMAFLGHVPCGHKIVVDHINNDQSDNRLENLQIITNRQNILKDIKNKTSKYTGVSWDSNRKKWQVGIKINGKRYALGRFNCEEEANQVYQNKLKDILC